MKQLGTFIVEQGNSGAFAYCTYCDHQETGFYDYDLARKIAEHSRTHLRNT